MQQGKDANPSHKRVAQAEQWLKEIGYSTALEKGLGDASHRNYWRLRGIDDRLLMDAPPDLESTQVFVNITERIEQSAVKTFKAPKIFVHEPRLGFLLLEDLGDTLFSQCYTTTDSNVIISLAIEALSDMQKNVPCRGLPLYDDPCCLRELELFTDWYLAQHRQVILSDNQQRDLRKCYDFLYANFVRQPQVFVHRDYHCRNLFYFKACLPSVAMIDYQDAVCGPQCYDLASLLKDAYYELSEEQVRYHLKTYWQSIRVRPAWSDFLETFYLTCLQRHLKVLGIFCRLNYRDKKPNYLPYLPLVKKYALETCEKYPQELRFLAELLVRE